MCMQKVDESTNFLKGDKLILWEESSACLDQTALEKGGCEERIEGMLR